MPPWKGDYHHDLNTQLSYWPCYSGNRLDEGLAYLDWLWNTRSNCIDWTRRFYGLPGMNVPMTSDLANNQFVNQMIVEIIFWLVEHQRLCTLCQQNPPGPTADAANSSAVKPPGRAWGRPLYRAKSG